MVPCDCEEASSQIYFGQAGKGNRAATCAFFVMALDTLMQCTKEAKYHRNQVVAEDPGLLACQSICCCFGGKPYSVNWSD